MTDYIRFPDVCELLCDYLAAQTSLPVGTRVPNPRPDEFFRVQRTGGPKHTMVSDAPTVVIESWAGDDATAHDLAQEARELINALHGQQVDDVQVYVVNEVSGPADLPDPLSSQSRYTQTFELHVRGVTTGS